MTASDVLSGITAAFSAALLTSYVILFVWWLKTKDRSPDDIA